MLPLEHEKRKKPTHKQKFRFFIIKEQIEKANAFPYFGSRAHFDNNPTKIQTKSKATEEQADVNLT